MFSVTGYHHIYMGPLTSILALDDFMIILSHNRIHVLYIRILYDKKHLNAYQKVYKELTYCTMTSFIGQFGMTYSFEIRSLT